MKMCSIQQRPPISVFWVSGVNFAHRLVAKVDIKSTTKEHEQVFDPTKAAYLQFLGFWSELCPSSGTKALLSL